MFRRQINLCAFPCLPKEQGLLRQAGHQGRRKEEGPWAGDAGGELQAFKTLAEGLSWPEQEPGQVLDALGVLEVPAFVLQELGSHWGFCYSKQNFQNFTWATVQTPLIDWDREIGRKWTN